MSAFDGESIQRIARVVRKVERAPLGTVFRRQQTPRVRIEALPLYRTTTDPDSDDVIYAAPVDNDGAVDGSAIAGIVVPEP